MLQTLPSRSCIFCDDTIITLKLFVLQRNTRPKPITIIKIIIKKGNMHLIGLSILRYIMINWKFELCFLKKNRCCLDTNPLLDKYVIVFNASSGTQWAKNGKIMQ